MPTSAKAAHFARMLKSSGTPGKKVAKATNNGNARAAPEKAVPSQTPAAVKKRGFSK